MLSTSLRAANGNRYEGSWEDDMKNGDGRFFYLDKGQMLTGFWVNDVAKCGTMEDFDRDSAPQPPKYPIPEVRAPMRTKTSDLDVSKINYTYIVHLFLSHLQCSLMDSGTVLDIAKEDHRTGSPS